MASSAMAASKILSRGHSVQGGKVIEMTSEVDTQTPVSYFRCFVDRAVEIQVNQGYE